MALNVELETLVCHFTCTVFISTLSFLRCVEHEVYLSLFQADEVWHSSDSEDSSADDAASSVGNSGSISQLSTPAASVPDDAFIPGVRSLRRRLVINDNTVASSRSRKRPAAEKQESTAAKLAKTTEEVGSTGWPATAAAATEYRQASSTARTGSKQRPLRPAVGAPPTQRAVLRIAQPDGTVCFLAIDNVSDISRLPVTAVVQQLLASQKQMSANHRMSLTASVVPRSAGAPVIQHSAELVPGFVVSSPRVASSANPSAQLRPVAAKPSVASTPSQSVLNPSLPLTSASVLPSLPVPSQLAQLPILRPQSPSPSNSLSAAMNRLRSQNVLAHLFQSRALNLRSVNAQTVNSQQLLNNILAARAAALVSTAPSTASSACRILPVVADQPVAFAVPVAVTTPSKICSASSTVSNLQPSLSSGAQLLNTGQPGYLATVASSSGDENRLLKEAGSEEVKRVMSSTAVAPIGASCPGSEINCAPLSANHAVGVLSTTPGSGAAVTPVAPQIMPSVSNVARIAAVGSPAHIRCGVTESVLAMAVRAAVAAGRAPNVLAPLNRPGQSRYVSGLTVKTLLENRTASSAESTAPSSAETVTCLSPGADGCSTSSTELNRSIVKSQVLSSGALSVRSGLQTQTAVQYAASMPQLAGRPMLAFLPSGVNVGPAGIQQLVAITATAASVSKPTVAAVSVAQLSLTSQAVARSVSRAIDVGALRAMIPQSKSRVPPSRPSRNNTRTTSVMKAPIPALPRLTDLGLATSSSADQISVSSSTVITAAMAPVNVLASPSATVFGGQAVTVSASSFPRTFTTATSTSRPAVALVSGGNKPVIVAAGASPLVVPQNNTTGHVYLVQSAGGGLVQLVQLPSVAAVGQSVRSRTSVPAQQVILAQRPAVSGNTLRFFSSSSAPVANSSTVGASVPIVQFIMRSSSNTISSSSNGTNSAASTARIIPVSALSSVETSLISSPWLTSSPLHSTVTQQVPVSDVADRTNPAIQQHETSSRQSTDISKSSCLADAADLFLMAASVVDRAAASATDADDNCFSAATNKGLSSPSTSRST